MSYADRYEQGRQDGRALEEFLGRGGKKITFNPDVHPRDRLGKFKETLENLKPGDTVKLPAANIRVERKENGFEVVSSGGGRAKIGAVSSAAWEALGRFDSHRPARKA